MYQGKFDAQTRGQQDPDQVLTQILKDRDAAMAARAAKKAAKAGTPVSAADLPKKKPAPAASGLPKKKPAPAASDLPAKKPAPAASDLPAKKPAPAAADLPAKKPAAASTDLFEKKPAAASADLFEQKPAAASADLFEQKPAAASADLFEKKPAPAASGLPQRKPATAASDLPQRKPAPAASDLPKKKPAAGAPAKKPAAAAPAKKPAEAKSAPVSREVPEKKGPRTGGLVFYACYFVFIFLFCVGIFLGLIWLKGWLGDYEAAQPTIKCQQVFDQLFTNPDWAQLYKLSGMQDTDFEGVDQYVEYMNTKVAGQELNFVETSAGLSQGKKYVVRLGKEKIAAFTLDGHAEKITDIPDWQLGKIELYVSRNESLTIRKLENHVVYVNGIPLDDSYTIQTASTVADQYLPVGTAGVRTSIQCIDGLMTVPTLVVYDETGANKVSVVYNPDSGMYEEQSDAIAMDEEERKAVFGALESYAGFMINASGSRAGVAKYFDGTSAAYKNIVAMNSELWMNSDHGHTFNDEEILGFTKYNDSLFSVRARLVMNATMKDGTNKRDFEVVQSMFFTKKNGSWVCYDMMNLDITQPVGKVRLTFTDGAGGTLSSEFYETSAASITCPVVTAPAGKVFSGWCKVTQDAEGNSTWTVVFTPDENGTVTVSSGSLTPMTLYPLFENA